MNESLQDLAAQYVLDQLGPSERSAFEALLERNPELATLVRELESTLAEHIRTLPRQDPPPGLLAQIEAQIEELAPVAPAPQSTGWRWWPILAGMAAAACVALALVIVRRAAPSPAFVVVAALDPSRSTLAEVPLPTNNATADARFIQLASMAEQYWNDPAQMPAKPAANSGESGYAVFDPRSEQGFVAVRHIPRLPAGQRYHLWLVDTAAGSVRSAGILPLEAATRGLFFFSVPESHPSASNRVGFFITIENSGPPNPLPRGKVVLGQNPI